MKFPVGFYREVLSALTVAEVPFLVGGAYAFCRHAAIDRKTKDLDLMIKEETWPAVARALRARGINTRLTFPHWLGKALSPAGQVDIIFNGGSGLTRVDDDWFRYGVPATVLGHRVRLCPPEELMWSKAFIMERERFDGADVLHLMRAHAERLDWARLCRRFTGHEAVLLAHLTLFAYVYPSEAARLPTWVVPALTGAARWTRSRWPGLPRHAHLARAVSRGRRRLGLRRCAAAAVRHDVRSRLVDVDERDRRETVSRARRQADGGASGRTTAGRRAPRFLIDNPPHAAELAMALPVGRS